MAGLLFALSAREGWAATQVRELLPPVPHASRPDAPGHLTSQRYEDAYFAIALTLPTALAPTVWHVTEDNVLVVIHGEYHHQDGAMTAQDAIAADLTKQYRRGTWATLRNGNGLYVLILWDSAKRTLVVANDAIGAQLLFRAGNGAGRVWSSEPGRLAGRGPLDIDALRSLLFLGYQADHRTLRVGTEVMPAATAERWSMSAGVLECAVETGLPPPADPATRFEDAFPEIFQDAVRIRLRGVHKVRLPLSGGEDSRLLLGATMALGCDVEAVTLDGGQRRDAPIAARIAAAVGISHRIEPLREYAITEHRPLLDAVLGTTSDWHGAIFAPLYQELDPAVPILLGYLGGTLSGAGVHASSASAGLAALRENTLTPYTRQALGEPAGLLAPPQRLMMAVDAPALPPELLINLYGRQRRYISFLMRLAWNFARPTCPFADVRLLRLALSADRRALNGQRARRIAFCRMFPRLAAIENGNDGLPITSQHRRWLRSMFKRSGAGVLLRRLMPQLPRSFSFDRLAALAGRALETVDERRRAQVPAGLPPMVLLALTPVLLQEDDEAVAQALALLGRPGPESRR